MENYLQFQFVDKQPARQLFVRSLLLTLGLLAGCLFQFSFAQTTIIGPANGGNFELDPTFAANGWTVENGAVANQWYVGTAATGFTGNAAYVSSDLGATNTYNTSSGSLVHFYRDVTLPIGEANVILSFQWKGQGEGTTTLYDGLQVSMAPTSVIPTASVATSSLAAGTPVVTGATVLGYTLYNLNPVTQTVTIAIPLAVTGNCAATTTRRLIFSWRNDATAGTTPPAAAVDNIVLTSAAFPLAASSPFTINNSLPTNGTNFNSFTAAVKLAQ